MLEIVTASPSGRRRLVRPAADPARHAAIAAAELPDADYRLGLRVVLRGVHIVARRYHAGSVAGAARHYRRRRGAGGGPAGRVVSHQGRESQPATIAVLTSAYPAWRLQAFPFFCGGVA